MELLLRIIKNQGGQALPMVLILLVLGGLLIVPMLSFMTTNLNANRIIESKTEGIYAADAGIQDALWKLGNGVEPFPGSDTSYNLTEDGVNPVLINGMTVTIEKVALDEVAGGGLYTVRSTARLDGQVKAVITAQAVAGSDYHWLFEHAITAGGDVNTSPNDTIYGGILCGGDFDGDATVNGEVVQGATIRMPTETQLTAFYLAQVDSDNETPYYYPSHGYSSGTYNVSGGTVTDPVMIPAMYRKGNLSIVGSGYAQLTGTIFLDRNADGTGGQFDLSDKDVILDLNGHTIYATYYGNCQHDAVNFGDASQIRGPGCVIGVGNVNFQPKLGLGKYLFGADPNDNIDTGAVTEFGDRVAMSQFTSNGSGDLGSIQVKCYVPDSEPAPPPAHVKVALYSDENNAPDTLLSWVDCTDNITVTAWKPVTLPSQIHITKNTKYWLAAIADSDVISRTTTSSVTNKHKDADFDTFSFSDKPLNLSDSTGDYQLRGFSGGQEFIFLMSVKCSTNLQPNANFYGCVAGNATVELKPGCFINMLGLPAEGIDFPGIVGSTAGPMTGGNCPPLLNYNIE